MTNLEFYKEEIRKEYNDSTYKGVSCEESMANALYTIKAKYDSHGKSLLDWLCEEHQILDKEEKEYLSAVIKPFRNKIISIKKIGWDSGDEIYEWLRIGIDDTVGLIKFPMFKGGTMYKGMELRKSYTLEELGL